MNLNYLLFSCLCMSCPCTTLLVCDESIFDYFMYVCASIGRFCSVWSVICVIFACLGVVVLILYLRTYIYVIQLLRNVLLNRPNISTIIILTSCINQSMCAERKLSIECYVLWTINSLNLNLRLTGPRYEHGETTLYWKLHQGWYSQSTLSAGKLTYRRVTPYLP